MENNWENLRISAGDAQEALGGELAEPHLVERAAGVETGKLKRNSSVLG